MTPECIPLGESALLMRWGNAMDAELNRRLAAFARGLTVRPFAGFREAAPAYCSLAVHYELTEATRFETVAATLLTQWEQAVESTAVAGRTIEIPVRYGGEDLAAMSQAIGFTEEEIIAIHTGRSYSVYMMGFLPGFAYLGEVDERIAAPRHRIPRLRVEAGSVGIAGKQTGVYPLASPGGWQIIGRTDLAMFDPNAATPTLLEPGDAVRFVAI